MRIRTIKPEFWISESMGRMSRDSRLLFIGLWNLADDHGRFRADPRYLAGALLPYDSDALKVVRNALSELAFAESIELFHAGGSAFGVIPGWSKHQRIDRKSESKYPDPSHSESIRTDTASILASPRRALVEPSSHPRESPLQDQGSGKGSGKGSGSAAPKAPRKKHAKETLHAPTQPDLIPSDEAAIWVPSANPVTRIMEFFADARGNRIEDLGMDPDDYPDVAIDGGRVGAVWLEWKREFGPDDTNARCAAFEMITAWLQDPFWASTERYGKPAIPYPFGSFLKREQWEKARLQAAKGVGQ